VYFLASPNRLGYQSEKVNKKIILTFVMNLGIRDCSEKKVKKVSKKINGNKIFNLIRAL
jgi:hypothetical protein